MPSVQSDLINRKKREENSNDVLWRERRNETLGQETRIRTRSGIKIRIKTKSHALTMRVKIGCNAN